jgi:sirohydrochlorin cobaltochelatase
MAGPGDETWENKLTKLGVETEPIIKAISENQMIVDIWLNHLQFAIDEFEAKNGLK